MAGDLRDAEPAAPLPLTLEEVTADWLTSALSSRHPGVEVTSVEVGDVIWGTATKVRLHLDYNDAGRDAGLPPTLILKAGLDEGMRALAGPGYANEVRFYNELALELEVNRPACHYAANDRSTGQGVLLLEDLDARNATYGNATKPISVDTAAATLDMQARYHAQWWGDSRLDSLGPGAASAETSGLVQHLFTEEHWARSMSLPRAEPVPEALRDRDRVLGAVISLWTADAKGPHCFAHGDSHLGNMFFEADGRPGYLDWQGITKGHWAQDVVYFLVGAIDVEDRRAHDRDLIAGYVDRLGARGAPAPSFDDAWDVYRRHLVHGFLWVLCPPEMQPEEICAANTLRFTTAVLDHAAL
jgi:aminoglycoside/choline kinase family phosphotransferase